MASLDPLILKKFESILKSNAEVRAAVFDVDGTLWPEDIGEAFFDHQIKNKSAPGLKNVADPWKYYRDLERRDPFVAYGWLAQINAGLMEKNLSRETRTFYEAHFKKKVNPVMRGLITTLMTWKIDVWICTASIRWAVNPLMEDLGLSFNRLIATEVGVDSLDRLTSILVEPIPHKDGKRHALKKKLKHPPLMVAGNSRGDFEMLSMATVLPLVVNFRPTRPEIQASEEILLSEAQKRNWPIQIFQQ